MLSLLLAVGGALAASAAYPDISTREVAAKNHLEIMMIYGMGPYNLGQQTLGKEGGIKGQRPWTTHLPYGLFADQVAAYRTYKVPSFYGDMSSPFTNPVGASKIFLRGDQCKPASYPVCHLGPEWEDALEMLVHRDIKPGLENGTVRADILLHQTKCLSVRTWS